MNSIHFIASLKNNEFFKQENEEYISPFEGITFDDFPDLTEQLDETKTPREKIALEVLANFLAGGRATGGMNSLDGMYPHHNFKVWEWGIKKLLNLNLPAFNSSHFEDILAGIKKMGNQCETDKALFNRFSMEGFLNFSNQCVKEIEGLRVGDSHPIYGGWGNVGGGTGHAIIYEIIHTKEGFYNFRLYTSTGFPLTQNVFSGEKQGVLPVISWDNIPKEHLLARLDDQTPPIFFQQLLEMGKAISKHDINSIVDDEDIKEILDYLKPYYIPPTFEDFGAITGQRAGTCVPSSTKSYIEFKVDDPEIYKPFKIFFNYILLKALHQELKDHLIKDTPKAEQMRRCLIYSARSLIGGIDKLVGQEIDLSTAKEMSLFLEDLIINIEELSQDVETKQKQNVLPISLPQSKRPSLSNDRYWINQMKLKGSDLPKASLLPNFQYYDKETLPEVLTCLDETLADLEKRKSYGYRQAANLTLNSGVDFLPIPIEEDGKNMWLSLSLQDKKYCCEKLGSLCRRYCNNLKSDLAPRRFATLFPLYAIVHFLALAIDKEEGRSGLAAVGSYSLPFDSDFLDEIDALTFHDQNEFLRIESAKEYFKSSINWEKPKLFASEIETEVVKDSIHEATGNGPFWNALMASNRDFELAVKQEGDVRFPDLSEEDILKEFNQQEKVYQEVLKTSPRQMPLSPKKQVNLPKITKWMAVLQEFDSKKEKLEEGNALVAPYFPHINVLRMTAHFIDNAIKDPEFTRYPLDRKATRKDKYSYDVSVSGPRQIITLSYPKKYYLSKWNNLIRRNYYHPLGNTKEKFLDREVCSRNKGSWDQQRAEAKILEEESPAKKQNEIPSTLLPLARTLSEWKLTPHQLLFETEKKFENFNDTSFQALFFSMFFRSPVKNGKVHIGVAELLEDKDLQENIKKFIHSGLNYFWNLTHSNLVGETDSNYIGINFLFEFSFFLQKYLPEGEGFNWLEESGVFEFLDQWINEDNISRKPRAIFRLYRILFHSLKNVESLEQSDLIEIFQDWFEVHLYTSRSRVEQVSPILNRYAKEFITKILAAHQSSFTDAPEWLCDPLLQFLNKTEGECHWQEDPQGKYPNFIGKTAENEVYHLDLKKGNLFINEALIKRVNKDHSWERTAEFKRLFWEERRFDYMGGDNGIVYFQHPQWGSFRILLAGYHEKMAIQKQFPGSEEWYQYYPSEGVDADERVLPEALTKDHALWAQVKITEVKRALPTQKQTGTCQIFLKTMTGKTITLEVDCEKSFNQQSQQLKEKCQDSNIDTSALRLIFAGIALDPNKPLNDYNIYKESTLHCVTGRGAFDSKTMVDFNFKENKTFTDNTEEVPIVEKPLPFKGIITSIKTGEVVSVVDEENQIFEARVKGNEISKGNQIHPYHWFADKHFEPLTRFEDSEYILGAADQNGRLNRLSFPRFCSLDGNSLSFEKDHTGLNFLWNDNQHYQLKEAPQALLGAYTSYLYLTPKNPQEPAKILVAYDAAFTNEDNSLCRMEEWRTRRYLVYNIEKNRVVPESVEGRWFLASLYLSQARYEEAVELITKMTSPIESIPPFALTLLNRIQNQNLKEDHPNGHMVRLHAAAQLFKELDKTATTKIPFYFKESKEDINTLNKLLYSAYCSIQSNNHITEGCLLQLEERKKLFQHLIKEIQEKKDWIKINKLKYPEVTVATIQHWLDSPQECIYFGQEKNSRLAEQPPLKTLYFLLTPKVEQPPALPPNPTKEEEQEVQRKQTLYLQYTADWQSKTSWLDKGSLPVLSTRYPSHIHSPSNNGALFLKVLKIAKEGTLSQRRTMLWNVRNWRLRWKGADNEIAYFDLMIQMLISPNSFPAPIDPATSSWEEKGDFLKKIQTGQNIHLASRNVETIISDFLFSTNSQNIPNSRSSKKQLKVSSSSKNNKKEISLQDFGQNREPLKVALATNDNQRFNKLKAWKADYFNENENPNAKKLEASTSSNFPIIDNLLSKQDENYRVSLQEDLNVFYEDFDEGQRQLAQEKNLTFKSGGSSKLFDDITKEKESCLTQLSLKKMEATKLLNTLPHESIEAFHKQARLTTKADHFISLKQGRGALLAFDKRAFKKLNPCLTDQEINTLSQLLLEIEDLTSWKKQLSRMEESVKELIQPSHVLGDTEIEELLRKLQVELESDYFFASEPFSDEEQVVFRIYCGRTGFIPFQKQVNLMVEMSKKVDIDSDRFRDCVIQLIMGGGKTTVIAAIIMQLTARIKGHAALFIVPKPLFKSVSANLTQSLKKAFDQTLEPIDIDRQQLTLYNIEKLLLKFEKAKETSTAIITTPSSIQICELEFLSQARKLKKVLQNIEFNKENPLAVQNLQALACNHRTMLKNLAKLIQTITNHADALIDEVDLVLDAPIEVNFPDGDKLNIPEERNELVFTIFSILLNSDLKIPTLNGNPKLKEVLKLETNKQSISRDQFQNHIAPVIAKALYDSIAEIKNRFSNEDSFLRFALQQIPYQLQEYADNIDKKLDNDAISDWRELPTDLDELQIDRIFLQQLREFANSPNEKDQKFAQVVSLIPHLLGDILPMTLNKHGNRNYGLVPKDPSGKICPFEASDTPAPKREFGYTWVELCYYYQWAAAFPTSPEVILKLAELAINSARYYMKKNGERFEETAEYLQFKELTGANLSYFQNPDSLLCQEGLNKALGTFKGDLSKRLTLQKEIISHQVKVQLEYLSANAITLCYRINSRRTMSGTPWNAKGFPKSLANNLIPDLGTEGKILSTLFEKVKDEYIYPVCLDSKIKNLLEHIYSKFPQPLQIRGAIDGGGLLKDFPTTLALVQETLEFLKEGKNNGRVDKDIKAVLFFNNNILYCWKIGANAPEEVGGTSAAALKAKGLKPEHYFTIFDESHSTGTDIPQVADAINILFYDEKMQRRGLTQSTMRLRKLLTALQGIIIAYDQDIKFSLYGEGKTMFDLTMHTNKNQSIRKTDDMMSLYRKQVKALFRGWHVDQLLDLAVQDKWDDELFVNAVDEGEPYFVETLQDDLYKLHGRLKRPVKSQTLLIDELEQKEKKHPELEKYKVEELKEHIQNAEELPLYTNTTSEDIGLEREQEAEAAAEVEQNVEQEAQVQEEVEEEIETQLQNYLSIAPGNIINDPGMSLEAFQNVIKDLNLEIPKSMSVEKQLQSFKYGNQKNPKQYDTLFKEPIYGTYHYFHACEGNLPIFHWMQRPPTQILAVNTKFGFRWLLVSEREANTIKKHLKNKPLEDVWLVQPNGAPLAPSLTPYPIDDENVNVLKGHLEINALYGNSEWLGKYERFLYPWIMENPLLAIEFLKLRTARRPEQRHILIYLPSILRITHSYNIKGMPSELTLFSKRAEWEMREINNNTSAPIQRAEQTIIKEADNINKIDNQKIDIQPSIGESRTFQPRAASGSRIIPPPSGIVDGPRIIQPSSIAQPEGGGQPSVIQDHSVVELPTTLQNKDVVKRNVNDLSVDDVPTFSLEEISDLQKDELIQALPFWTSYQLKYNQIQKRTTMQQIIHTIAVSIFGSFSYILLFLRIDRLFDCKVGLEFHTKAFDERFSSQEPSEGAEVANNAT